MTPPTTTDHRPHDPEGPPPTPRAHAQYSKIKVEKNTTTQDDDDDDDEDKEEEEEDEYDKRIARTGCAAENEALQLCFAEKHDWRACKDVMIAFRECWKRNGNVQAEE
ncbi:hypothetical protein BGZ65_008214 [Modicella reniformis]|uniref:CHCH domain-containing protein n=1 Tax=Modicella reniformis TaxID=1440133 RepID=A0A9P6LX67_9FUNG|nr:hypothetical protein BGZ65_008214 [Modicella reniformis]